MGTGEASALAARVGNILCLAEREAVRKVFRHQSHRIDYIAEKDNTWWWWRQWRRMTLASSPFALVVLELGNPNCR